MPGFQKPGAVGAVLYKLSPATYAGGATLPVSIPDLTVFGGVTTTAGAIVIPSNGKYNVSLYVSSPAFTGPVTFSLVRMVSGVPTTLVSALSSDTLVTDSFDLGANDRLLFVADYAVTLNTTNNSIWFDLAKR